MRLPIGTLFGILHRKADADTDLPPKMPIWFPDRHRRESGVHTDGLFHAFRRMRKGVSMLF